MMSGSTDEPERLLEILRELVALTGATAVPKPAVESTEPAADAQEIRDRDVIRGAEQVSD
jgi:hypothetical protein